MRARASPSSSPGADAHGSARGWIERLAPHPITYTDAVSFAVMQALDCRHVLGFDQDFEVAGFELWRRTSGD